MLAGKKNAHLGVKPDNLTGFEGEIALVLCIIVKPGEAAWADHGVGGPGGGGMLVVGRGARMGKCITAAGVSGRVSLDG